MSDSSGRLSDDPKDVAARKLDLVRARKLWHASFVVLFFGTFAAVGGGGGFVIGRLAGTMSLIIAFLGWMGTNTPHRSVRWLCCGAAMALAVATVLAAFLIGSTQ